MATAIRPLQRFQIGIETTPGTPVAATVKIPGDHTWTHNRERYFANFPRGVRAPVTQGGKPIAAGLVHQVNTDLSYEDILYPLTSGILGLKGGSTGAGPYVHTFTPVLTGDPAVDTLTLEYVESDGAANHVGMEADYAFCTQFGLQLTYDQIAMLNYQLAAHEPADASPTADPGESADREEIASNDFSLYIDTTGAGIGSTQVSSIIRSLSLDVDTGLRPRRTIDGTLNHTGIRWGSITGRASMTFEMDAVAAGLINAYEAAFKSNKRFIRLSSGSGTKALQFDFCLKLISAPQYAEFEGDVIVTLDGELEYDATWAKVFEAIVTTDTDLIA